MNPLARASKVFAALVLAVVAAVAVVGVVEAVPAHAGAGGSLNSGGQHVFAALKIDDATGVVTTVAAAGTAVAVGGSPMALYDTDGNDGSGCITATVVGGVLTIAKPCGVGDVRVRACLGDAAGVNSATWTAAIFRTRSGVSTRVSNQIRETEGGTLARDSEGCVEVIDRSALSDTYTLRVDSGTNADTVTIRGATFSAERLAQF